MFDFDITFCANRACPKSESCWRSIKRLDTVDVEDPRVKWISMAEFKPAANGDCKHYISKEKYEDHNK